MKIPLAKPYFLPEDAERIKEVLNSGWVVQGPKVSEFETAWSEFTGARHSVAVSSCTTALHLALIASGIGKGDEVILPSFTWIATANAVEYTGAKPVFCDINTDTFNIDSTSLAKHISADTKAVIPVHLFGLSADIDSVSEVLGDKNITVIEDAACGFGAYRNGEHSGLKGRSGCFSFHPRKAITTGEGGMIVTRNEEDAAILRQLRDHGANTEKSSANVPYLLPEFNILGYNYRMTDIQAALGTAQVRRADDILKKRRAIAAKYDIALKDVEFLSLPKVQTGCIHGYQSYVCMFVSGKMDINSVDAVSEKRNKFMQYLSDNGISTRPGTHAVHAQKYYSEKYGLNHSDYPNSYIADRCSVALPVYPGMTDEEFGHIEEVIKKYK